MFGLRELNRGARCCSMHASFMEKWAKFWSYGSSVSSYRTVPSVRRSSTRALISVQATLPSELGMYAWVWVWGDSCIQEHDPRGLKTDTTTSYPVNRRCCKQCAKPERLSVFSSKEQPHLQLEHLLQERLDVRWTGLDEGLSVKRDLLSELEPKRLSVVTWTEVEKTIVNWHEEKSGHKLQLENNQRPHPHWKQHATHHAKKWVLSHLCVWHCIAHCLPCSVYKTCYNRICASLFASFLGSRPVWMGPKPKCIFTYERD